MEVSPSFLFINLKWKIMDIVIRGFKLHIFQNWNSGWIFEIIICDDQFNQKFFKIRYKNKLEKRIGSSFKKTKSEIYPKDKNGFYIYAKPNLCDPNSIVKYVSRTPAAQSSPFPELILTIVITWPFITTNMKIILSLERLFLLTMGYDPLQCPNCKKEMLFLEMMNLKKASILIFFNHRLSYYARFQRAFFN